VLTARLSGWKDRVREFDIERGRNERLYITFVPQNEQ
jgi:hypothetical protein